MAMINLNASTDENYPLPPIPCAHVVLIRRRRTKETKTQVNLSRRNPFTDTSYQHPIKATTTTTVYTVFALYGIIPIVVQVLVSHSSRVYNTSRSGRRLISTKNYSERDLQLSFPKSDRKLLRLNHHTILPRIL